MKIINLQRFTFNSLLHFFSNLIILCTCFSQSKNLIYIQGKNDLLLDTNGQVFFELPENYELANINAGNFLNRYTFQNDVQFEFSGFPILIKDKKNNNYALINKEKAIVKWLPSNINKISSRKDNFYLASFERNQKLFSETRYQYFFLDGNPIFSGDGYSKATPFNEGYAVIRKDGYGWRFINDLGQEFDWIPDSLKNAERISAVENGYVLITLLDRTDKKQTFEKPYLLNMPSREVFDISSYIKGKKIFSCDLFSNGWLIIKEPISTGNPYKGISLNFINTSTSNVISLDKIYDYHVSTSGHFIVQQHQEDDNRKYLLYNEKGMTLPFPENVHHVRSLGGPYYDLFIKENSQKKYILTCCAIKLQEQI